MSTMKFIIILITGCILCVLAQTYLMLWWIFVPLTFCIACLVRYSSGKAAFWTGTLIVCLSWLSIYFIKDAANDSLLSNKMAEIFSLPGHYALFIAAAILMGVIGGLSSLAGYALTAGRTRKEKVKQ